MDYLISWTFKVVPPEGGEPDFIRCETTITSDEQPMEVVNQLRAKLMAAGWTVTGPARGVQRKPQEAPQQAQKAPQPIKGSEPLAEGVDGSDVTWKAMLERRPDKRYTLVLWGYLSDGRQMEYPLLRYTADKDEISAMLAPVGMTVEDSEVPWEMQVEWIAHWKFGKQAKSGRYKDLLRLEQGG